MAFLHVENVKISGISACVPSHKDKIEDIYKWPGLTGFTSTTGITSRRRASHEVTSADLCLQAAEKLIEQLAWDKSDIDIVVFVTQTPDYILPATSCVIQDKLGLSTDCYALDISLGCSGWFYALSVIASLMQSGSMKKGLLLAGETATKLCSFEDKGTYPLFGDAGTATALQFAPGCSELKFVFNNNGKGFETIIVKDGGYRNPVTASSIEYNQVGEGRIKRLLDVDLEGGDVFSFGISKAPKSVKSLCENFKIDMDCVNLFTFHQANKMMNEMIRRKLNLPKDRVPYCLEEFGNTSSASIPLTLVTREGKRLRENKVTHIACGFGVGLSWGSVYFETDHIVIPNLIEL